MISHRKIFQVPAVGKLWDGGLPDDYSWVVSHCRWKDLRTVVPGYHTGN